MSKFKVKVGDKVYSSWAPYTGEYTYKGKSYLNCNYALVVDESGQEFQIGYDDLTLVGVVENTTIKNFNVGDKVKIRQAMWNEHSHTLSRLGFREPSCLEGFEVSQIFENQKRISLKGCSNIYNSEYFELCVEEQTTEMTFKPDAVNSPKHYSVFEKLEAIEVIASSMTSDQFYGYCLGNILKYRLRAGGKDDVMQELGKADKYQELFTKYKHLCKGV